MKASEIIIGERYAAKVSGSLETVLVLELTGTYSPRGGFRDAWWVVNCATGRRIKVRSPQRFRFPVDGPDYFDRPVRMMPGQTPYTPEERVQLADLISSACQAQELIPADELEQR